MNELHTEHLGEFRWLSIAYDEPAGRVTLADLPCGLFVERVDGRGEPLVSVADSEGCEVTLTVAQVTELRTALGELPGP